jgi:5-methylcytosine-specific restriction protein A
VNKTTKVFLVQNGTKEENQKKAKWRHGTGSSPPGLGPSLGWVKVPVDDLSKLSSKELGDALRQSNSRYVSIFSSNVMEPIICNTPEKLEAEIDALYQNPAPGIPKGQRKPQRSTGTTEYLSRDARVASYVLRESGGNCECCSSTAPFLKSNGVPYLEVHHVKTLSAGGTDFITNTVAVCPNCHRELHYGANKNNLKSKLYSNVERLIPE